MRILVLNWRDIRNPTSGGAEILTHEMEKRWVKEGHSVTQFSSYFPGAKKEETIDGIKILRRGHADARFVFWSVHFLAFFYYIKYFRNRFDIVIDEVHGLPFFTPWFVKEKKAVLICEVAGGLWKRVYGPLLGGLGRAVEIFYLRYVYRSIPFITISESTKRELINNGIQQDRITVLPMGISYPPKFKPYLKEETPTLVFVGRLSKTKGVEDAILALKEIGGKYPDIKFWIIGKGEMQYESYLKKLCIKLGLKDKIRFFGFVSQDQKFKLMSRAHILVVPSAKEGWGLVVNEAGICGTPSVVYNTAGLRDIVEDGTTGILVEKSPHGIAGGVVRLLSDRNLYKHIQIAAWKQAKEKNWDNTANFALSIFRQ